jgi:hypothetical protein
MFDRLLKTALDTGAEVIVETKYECNGVKGRVLDFDGQHFSIFHSGTDGGMLWVFRLVDVAYCGLVLELPSSLSELALPETLSGNLGNPAQSCSHQNEDLV